MPCWNSACLAARAAEREWSVPLPSSTLPGCIANCSEAGYETPYPPSGAEAGHQQEDRLPHVFSTHIPRCFDLPGAELKIMQELLRHSTIRVTFDTSMQAVATGKRTAQEAVVHYCAHENQRNE